MGAAIDSGGGYLAPVVKAALSLVPNLPAVIASAPTTRTLVQTHPSTSAAAAIIQAVAPYTVPTPPPPVTPDPYSPHDPLTGLPIGPRPLDQAIAPPPITPAPGTVLRQDYVPPSSPAATYLATPPAPPAPGTVLRQDYTNPNFGITPAPAPDPYSPHDPLTGLPIGPRPLDQAMPSPNYYPAPGTVLRQDYTNPSSPGATYLATPTAPPAAGTTLRQDYVNPSSPDATYLGNPFTPAPLTVTPASDGGVPSGGQGGTGLPYSNSGAGQTPQQPFVAPAPIGTVPSSTPPYQQATYPTAFGAPHTGIYNAWGQLTPPGVVHGTLEDILAGMGVLNHVQYGPELTGLSGYGGTMTPNGTPAVMSAWQRANLDPTSIANYGDYAHSIAGWNPDDLTQYTQRITGNIETPGIPKNYAPIGIQPSPGGG